MRGLRRFAVPLLAALSFTVVAGNVALGARSTDAAGYADAVRSAAHSASANKPEALQTDQAAIRQGAQQDRAEGGIWLLAALYCALALTALPTRRLARGVRVAQCPSPRVFTPARLRAPPSFQLV